MSGSNIHAWNESFEKHSRRPFTDWSICNFQFFGRSFSFFSSSQYVFRTVFGQSFERKLEHNSLIFDEGLGEGRNIDTVYSCQLYPTQRQSFRNHRNISKTNLQSSFRASFVFSFFAGFPCTRNQGKPLSNHQQHCFSCFQCFCLLSFCFVFFQGELYWQWGFLLWVIHLHFENFSGTASGMLFETQNYEKRKTTPQKWLRKTSKKNTKTTKTTNDLFGFVGFPWFRVYGKPAKKKMVEAFNTVSKQLSVSVRTTFQRKKPSTVRF